MRYRKSIKICNGVRLNFSKSGVSTTIGGKGCSVNIGKNGAYLNTGIPGTGFYDRTRLDSPSNNKRKNNSTTVEYPQGDISVFYETDGTLSFYDCNNNPITNPTIIKKIKSGEDYKQKLEEFGRIRMENYEQEINKFTKIKELSPSVKPTNFYELSLHNLKPETYIEKPYAIPAPTMQSVIEHLTIEAQQEIKTVKFWTKNKLINQYIEKRKEEIYSQRINQWNSEKEKFENQEKEIASVINKQNISKYEKQKEFLENLLNNNPKIIEIKINEWLKNITFSFDFNFQYNIEDSKISIDLDLPEIENMLLTKAQKMANGTVKLKDKSKKELYEDYYQCVLGLAIYITTNIFNLAYGIQTIIISGYTQRRDKKGNICNDYIYSIKFNRNTLANINLNSFTSEEIILKFENRLNVTTSKTFKNIVPYE